MSPTITHKWLPRAKELSFKFLPIIFGGIVLTYFVIGAVKQNGSKEAGSVFWIGLLFFIPLVVQGLALIFLANRRVNWCYYFFNLTVTTICFGSCFYFWVSYFDDQQSGERLQALSYRTLYVILLLLIGVGVMTYAIMRPSSDHVGGEFCNRLNSGVREHPFWAIMFFFTLFVGVAYLFGFTLAFHDKYATKAVAKDDPDGPRPALRMVNLKSVDDLPKSVPKDEAKVNTFSFYFKSGGAHLAKDMDNICNESSPPKRQWNRTPSGPKDTEEFNGCNLKALARTIKEVTEDGKRVRVTLIGHGDREPINLPAPRLTPRSTSLHYLSNYELSEARAQNIKYELLQMFSHKERWRNIEWLLLPASNENLEEIQIGLINRELFDVKELQGTFTQDEIAKGVRLDQLKEKIGKEKLVERLFAKLTPERLAEESRVVLVTTSPVPYHIANLEMKQIAQDVNPGTLALMDYMYFSIYTITTTGYGDIVPTTAYAKFVTSLANFCEVLFLVVFFNALISLKGRPPGANADHMSPSNSESPGDDEMAEVRQKVLRPPFSRKTSESSSDN